MASVVCSPLISIFSYLIHIPESQRPREVHFLYGSGSSPELDTQKILFLPRLLDLVAAAADPTNVTLSLFFTGTGIVERLPLEDGKLPNRTFARRMRDQDLVHAIDGLRQGGAISREGTVCYVCGPARMTDEFVDLLGQQDGMSPDRVLCEKWW